MYERPLPANNKLESEILGTLIFKVSNNNELLDYLQMLNIDLFSDQLNQNVFKELLESATKGKPEIPSIIVDSGDRLEWFANSGILPFRLCGEIEKLKELKTRRETVKAAHELLNQAYDDSKSQDDLIFGVNNAANTISGLKEAEKPNTLKVIRKALERAKKAASGDDNERIFYCHDMIDDKLKLFRKQIHTYGADQGGGKTALALDCFRQQIKSGMRCVYFCTESTAHELLLRMAAADQMIKMEDILTGNFKGNSFDGFKKSMDDFTEKHENFWIIGLGDWDCTTATANSILSRIERESGQLDAVYWDFLQDMREPRGMKNPDILKVIHHNIKAIHQITSNHNVASSVLSQFRKERADKKPTKADFWGAAAIIDSSHIMSVLHSEQKQGDEPPSILQLWWYSVKTRLIRPWSRQVIFNGAYGTFSLPAPQSRYATADRPKSNHNKGAVND